MKRDDRMRMRAIAVALFLAPTFVAASGVEAIAGCFNSAFGEEAGCESVEHGDYIWPASGNNSTGGTYHAGCVDRSLADQHSAYSTGPY